MPLLVYLLLPHAPLLLKRIFVTLWRSFLNQAIVMIWLVIFMRCINLPNAGRNSRGAVRNLMNGTTGQRSARNMSPSWSGWVAARYQASRKVREYGPAPTLQNGTIRQLPCEPTAAEDPPGVSG